MEQFMIGDNNGEPTNTADRNRNNSTSDISQRSRGVEDITNRLDQMNVDMLDTEEQHQHHNYQVQPPNYTNLHHYPQQQQQQQQQSSLVNTFALSQQNLGHPNLDHQFDHHYGSPNMDTEAMMTQDDDEDNHFSNTTDSQPHGQTATSNILIVTNVDSSVFSDKLVQAKFESLFLAYDSNVTFRYLKSFRRVRLDFTSARSAELARTNLSQYQLGNTIFKCYSAHIIRANFNNNNNNINNDDDQQDQDSPGTNSMHLNIPKLTKQFLISPPASPPVGWEPVNEGSPCIDVQLISAIANLVPGKVHEIHPASESQPGIFVEVCEDVSYDTSMRSCSRIPRTMAPSIVQARP